MGWMKWAGRGRWSKAPADDDKRHSQTRLGNRKPALAVDFFDDLERADALGESGGGFAIQPDVLQERARLHGPRFVAPWVLKDRRFRRAHFRKHLVQRKALDPIASAQAIDGD